MADAWIYKEHDKDLYDVVGACIVVPAVAVLLY